jgi:isopentenyl diphosphate isomerase/L-lactate dehydrogenase-like FMN-dependent dehydrogenase
MFGQGFGADCELERPGAASYGLPVVVQGLLTAEDAALASERGAAAVVVVSNHGGRELDSEPPSDRSVTVQ